jgi:MFS transporter, DHA2 family, multidrug resistance protein
MASGTADLQRDLGGALMQSIFGALLAAGYAAAMTAALAGTPEAAQAPSTVTNELTMSYAGAQSMATAYPQYATQITDAAKTSFLAGDQYAYMAGIIAVLIGAALVFFKFPKHDEERKLLMDYHAEDMATMAAAPPSGTVTPARHRAANKN